MKLTIKNLLIMSDMFIVLPVPNEFEMNVWYPHDSIQEWFSIDTSENCDRA